MLSILETPRRIRSFATYDLEWVPGLMTLRLVGVYDKKQGYRHYTSIASFLSSECTRVTRGKWFFAHFGGIADAQFLLAEIIKTRRYTLEGSFSGSSANIIKLRRDNAFWYFIDSAYLIRDRLANVAKYVDMEKGGGGYEEAVPDPNEEGISDAEFELRSARKREWYATVALSLLREYNEQDCRILYEAIDLLEDFFLSQGGTLQMTLASSAMALFRRKFLKSPIETGERINRVARKAYIASRVEVFQRDVYDAYYYDINSSFPYAMTSPIPGRLLGVSTKIPDFDRELTISDCEVEVPEIPIPPLPLRSKSRIFFPTGRWRAWFTSIDLQLLIEEGGRIMHHHSSYRFESRDDAREFAETIYAARKAAKTPFESLAYKLTLNSLYGKFAEESEKQGIFVGERSAIKEAGEVVQYAPGVYALQRTVALPHVHVPISAFITAMARRNLYCFLSECVDVHYCDTDGFSTTEHLEQSQELGGLKLEKIVHHGVYRAPKVYSIEGETLDKHGQWKISSIFKAKGFSRMSASRFARMLEGETIQYERMRRIKEGLRNGVLTPSEISVVKKLQSRSIWSDEFDYKKHQIPKRFTYPDGHTRPWDTSELEAIGFRRNIATEDE